MILFRSFGALFLLLPLLHAQSTPMLRAHVEFLASDAMGGRACPSKDCTLASEYILAQFRGAGLETQVQTTEPILEIKRGDVSVQPAQPIGPVVLDAPGKLDAQGAIRLSRADSIPKSTELDPIYNASGNIAVSNVPAGLRNVIGVIRGRDPVLRDTYVLVTAHYDHEGTKSAASGDTVFNGANDNASGVAALIEIARSIAAAPVKPRRSIAFIAYFGEEKGMVGSRYYARNPVFPVAKTYAQVNFEQLGRTDDLEGPRVKAATVTGWDRSRVGAVLAAAARPAGVRIYKHEKFSEAFFERSDNEALAKLGVPAHTISVAYGFPDYHAAGDDADKIDYANMTTVVRALRTGIVALANRTTSLAPAPAALKPQAAPTKPSKPKRVPVPIK